MVSEGEWDRFFYVHSLQCENDMKTGWYRRVYDDALYVINIEKIALIKQIFKTEEKPSYKTFQDWRAANGLSLKVFRTEENRLGIVHQNI